MTTTVPEPTPPAPTAPAPVPTPPPPVVPAGYISQVDADRIAGQARSDGARKTIRDRYGVDKLEDLDAIVKRAKDAEQANLSEAERARADAETAKAAAAAERTALAQERLAIRLERAATAVQATAPGSVAALLTAQYGLGPDSDDAAVTAALDKLKAAVPALFPAAPPAGVGAQPPVGGQPPMPGWGGTRPPATPAAPPGGFGSAGLEEARRRGYVKTPTT